MNRENLTDNAQLYQELMELLAPAEREYGEIVGGAGRGRHLAWAASLAACLVLLALWGWEQRSARDVCVVRRDGHEVVSPPACELMERQMAEMFNP